MRSILFAVLTVVIFVFTSSARAETNYTEAFELINRIVKNDVKHGFPSAQLAVMKDGEFLYENAWGEGITEDTLFDLASNTKVYSVVYAAQYLSAQGILNIDIPITELAGQCFAEDVLELAYPNDDADSADRNTQMQWKRSITVRDVLCHRAGLPAEAMFLWRKDYAFANADANPLFVGCDAAPETRAKVLDALCKMPLYYEPRTRVLYSDTDYVLLGLLIENITGMNMQDFLRETFWEPLELTHITYKPLEHGFTKADCAPTELHGNTRDGAVFFDGIRTDTIRGEVHDETAFYAMAGISGHAGLFANAHDLALLANAMLNPSPFFPDEVIHEFQSPASGEHDEWGIGWYRQGNLKRTKYFGTLAGENTIGHQGWTGTLTVIDSEQRLVLVLLTSKRNTPVTNPAVNPNDFDGNYYTTAKLGFSTQLIYDAICGQPLDATLQTLVNNMEEQYESTPCDAAMSALESIRETQSEWQKNQTACM